MIPWEGGKKKTKRRGSGVKRWGGEEKRKSNFLLEKYDKNLLLNLLPSSFSAKTIFFFSVLLLRTAAIPLLIPEEITVELSALATC